MSLYLALSDPPLLLCRQPLHCILPPYLLCVILHLITLLRLLPSLIVLSTAQWLLCHPLCHLLILHRPPPPFVVISNARCPLALPHNLPRFDCCIHPLFAPATLPSHHSCPTQWSLSAIATIKRPHPWSPSNTKFWCLRRKGKFHHQRR